MWVFSFFSSVFVWVSGLSIWSFGSQCSNQPSAVFLSKLVMAELSIRNYKLSIVIHNESLISDNPSQFICVCSFEHTYVPWRDNAIRRRLTVIHKSLCLTSERPHNWVIISLGSLVRFWYRTSFLHATILWGLLLAIQHTLCVTCRNMSITSPYYVYARTDVPFVRFCSGFV